MRPPSELELVVGDVGADQLLVGRTRLIDLASVDLHRNIGFGEAAHARTINVRHKAHPDGVARRRAREVEPRIDRVAADRVPLAGEVELSGVDLQIEPPPLPGTKREP